MGSFPPQNKSLRRVSLHTSIAGVVDGGRDIAMRRKFSPESCQRAGRAAGAVRKHNQRKASRACRQ